MEQAAAASTSAHFEARARVDGQQELLPQGPLGGVGGQLERVEAGGGRGQLLVVPAHAHAVHGERRLQRLEPQRRRPLAGGHEPQQRAPLPVRELPQHAPEPAHGRVQPRVAARVP
ncbi:unnamed protein product, partial [Heterosigma akashiwo]